MKKTKEEKKQLFCKMMKEEGLTRSPRSDEVKSKISTSNKGKILGKIHKIKIGYGNQGRKISEEHKKSISKSNETRDVSIKQTEGFFSSRGVILPSLEDKLIREEQESIQKLRADPFK